MNGEVVCWLHVFPTPEVSKNRLTHEHANSSQGRTVKCCRQYKS